ncbi:MAG: hypothetical protein EBS86_17375 [Crocinitomicaceae bacterium]|jgi:hypothetical protein|nr:hypothetical protein [Crocinitomicaceae bacterium]
METTNLTNDMEFNRFGWISMIILVVGCLGGLTVGLGAIENTAALVVVIIPTMITLSLLLAVSPMKWVMTSAAATISIDILLLSYYILS